MKQSLSWKVLLVLAVVCYGISYAESGSILGDMVGFLAFILLALGIVNLIVALVKKGK
jgi:mannose/fructose/N-acetylgalactosamine-specific phosphotransferase system component IID